MTKPACASIVRAAFEFARKHGRKSVTLDREAQRPARDRRPDARHGPRGRQGLPRHPVLGRQRRRHLHVAAQEPARLRRPRRREHVRRHRLATWPPSSSAGSASPAAATSATSTPSSSRPTARAPKYAGQYKVNPIAMLLTAKMMLDWLGETDKAAASKPPSPRSSRKARSGPTTWAARPRRLDIGRAVAAKLWPRRQGSDVMLVLAVDTTTPQRVGGPPRGGTVLLGETGVESPATHSARLLRRIDFLLGAHGLRRQATSTAFAVAAGPGSFTGIRIGSARSRPWLSLRASRSRPVSTLLALAAEALPGPGTASSARSSTRKRARSTRPLRIGRGRPHRDHPPGRLRPGRVLRPAAAGAGDRLRRAAASPSTGRSF